MEMWMRAYGSGPDLWEERQMRLRKEEEEQRSLLSLNNPNA